MKAVTGTAYLWNFYYNLVNFSSATESNCANQNENEMSSTALAVIARETFFSIHSNVHDKMLLKYSHWMRNLSNKPTKKKQKRELMELSDKITNDQQMGICFSRLFYSTFFVVNQQSMATRERRVRYTRQKKVHSVFSFCLLWHLFAYSCLVYACMNVTSLI